MKNKIEFQNVKEILDKTVTKNGTGSHISVPLKYLNKKVKVVVFNE